MTAWINSRVTSPRMAQPSFDVGLNPKVADMTNAIFGGSPSREMVLLDGRLSPWPCYEHPSLSQDVYHPLKSPILATCFPLLQGDLCCASLQSREG